MSSEKRAYAMKARAARQQETRRRIVEATAALHREVGPARTTVSAIARRAGVQRLTVYTHFPDEEQLIVACQEHNLALQPPPNLANAFTFEEPDERLRAVLTLMYGWYRQIEVAFVPVLRDRGAVPALDQVLQRVLDAPQAQLAADLAAGFACVGQRGERLRAVVHLALDFWTWRRLTGEGLDDAAATDVMASAIAALAASNAGHAAHSRERD
ncbi:MAG: TetR/AcrR family transcriptional regulator [Chloroflexota bacterium]|nr:TetR/AcrR family transcriptional regulator [Chloroflexota bacterium]